MSIAQSTRTHLYSAVYIVSESERRNGRNYLNARVNAIMLIVHTPGFDGFPASAVHTPVHCAYRYHRKPGKTGIPVTFTRSTIIYMYSKSWNCTLGLSLQRVIVANADQPTQ